MNGHVSCVTFEQIAMDQTVCCCPGLNFRSFFNTISLLGWPSIRPLLTGDGLISRVDRQMVDGWGESEVDVCTVERGHRSQWVYIYIM